MSPFSGVTLEEATLAAIYGLTLAISVYAHLCAEDTRDWRTCLWLLRLWAVFLLGAALASWQMWRSTFADRPPKHLAACPSHYRRPDAGGAAANDRWSTPFTCKRGSLIDLVEGTQGHFSDSAAPAFEPSEQASRRGTALGALSPGDAPKRRCISSKRALHLSMDHLPLSFTDVLWCSLFVVPPAVANFVVGGANTTGLVGIIAARALAKLGFGRACSDPEARRMVGEFLLGIPTLALYCAAVEGGTATFAFHAVTQIVDASTVRSGDFECAVDLSTRCMCSATFHGRAVGPHDAMALAFNMFGGYLHTVSHSYANWAVNTSRGVHWFVRRMGVITVKYNNIGVQSYPWVMGLFRRVGLTSHTSEAVTRLTCYMNHTVPRHHRTHRVGSLLSALRAHSGEVDFVFRVRQYFLSEFEKHQSDFPGVDGEALFIGTVLHSLDHRNAGHIVDNRIFSCSHRDKDPGFSEDHEWACVTHACAVDRPPLRLFNCSFERAGHPFYRKVYAFAARIDVRLASYMEAAVAL